MCSIRRWIWLARSMRGWTASPLRHRICFNWQKLLSKPSKRFVIMKLRKKKMLSFRYSLQSYQLSSQNVHIQISKKRSITRTSNNYWRNRNLCWKKSTNLGYTIPLQTSSTVTNAIDTPRVNKIPSCITNWTKKKWTNWSP